MHTVLTDIVIMWVAAFALLFAIMLFGSASIQDRENTITSCISVSIILLGAIAVTIGQLVGWIGVW